jgi:hypothetical protein
MKPKLMIFNGFQSFPPELWITLWATCPERAETLAAPCFGKDCPLSGQPGDFNEIKHLARFGEISMLRCNTRNAATEVAAVLGISQALSAHLPAQTRI